MKQIPESELIINDRGAVYHLDARPEEIAHTIITVGDPDRVSAVSKYFDSIEVQRKHREFVTHTGRIGQQKITALSTGIGTDNIDIVLNELDALVNIDLDKRIIKNTHTPLTIVRIGTAGSLQKKIPVDDFVVSTHGLGIDNLLHFYRRENNEEERSLLQAFITHTQLSNQSVDPYITAGSMHLLKQFVAGFHHGITVTCPGFYGPQGRVLRMGLAFPDFIDRLTSFQYGQNTITNFEMETAGIYGLGKLLGHQCLSISAIVANRIEKKFSTDGEAAVDKLIQKVLDVLN